MKILNTVIPLVIAMTQCSPFIMLFLESKEMYPVISEFCYRGIFLENDHLMVIFISWSFSLNIFVKFQAKKIWEPQKYCFFSKSVF